MERDRTILQVAVIKDRGMANTLNEVVKHLVSDGIVVIKRILNRRGSQIDTVLGSPSAKAGLPVTRKCGVRHEVPVNSAEVT